jgi:hypothetical protein
MLIVNFCISEKLVPPNLKRELLALASQYMELQIELLHDDMHGEYSSYESQLELYIGLYRAYSPRRATQARLAIKPCSSLLPENVNFLDDELKFSLDLSNRWFQCETIRSNKYVSAGNSCD